MRVKLIERKLTPKSIPIALEIKPKVFEGENSSEILEQIKHYFAEKVIPRIPFLRLDEPYRQKVRQMSSVELSRTLVDYINSQDPRNEDHPMPENDDEALDVLERMKFLNVER